MVLKLHMLKGCPFCTRVILAVNATDIEVEYIIHIDRAGKDNYVKVTNSFENP